MSLLILVLLIVAFILHLRFLMFVFSELGFWWFLGILFVPFIGLFLYYKNWDDLKGIFLGQVACYLVVGIISEIL